MNTQEAVDLIRCQWDRLTPSEATRLSLLCQYSSVVAIGAAYWYTRVKDGQRAIAIDTLWQSDEKLFDNEPTKAYLCSGLADAKEKQPNIRTVLFVATSTPNGVILTFFCRARLSLRQIDIAAQKGFGLKRITQ